MMKNVLKSKRSPRRRESRRPLPQVTQSVRDFVRTPKAAWSALYLLIFTACASVLMLYGGLHYHVNDFVETPIVSRVAFKSVDEIKTERNARDAYEREPRFYQPNLAYMQVLQDRFDDLIAAAEKGSLDKLDESYRERVGMTEPAFAQLQTYLNNPQARERWNELTRFFIQYIFSIPILDPDAYVQESTGANNKILIHLPKPGSNEPSEQARYPSEFVSIENEREIERSIRNASEIFPSSLQPVINNVMALSPQPTYFLDGEATEKRRQRAAERVQPVINEYRPNDLLVPAGKMLTAEDIVRLDAEQASYKASKTGLAGVMYIVGNIGVVFIIGLGLWGYLFAYKHRIIENPMRGLGLITLLLAAQAIAVFMVQLDTRMLFLAGTLPTLLVAIVLTIAYEQRFALAVGAIHAVLVIVSIGVTLPLLLVLMAGVAISTWQLDEIRTRSKLVEVGLYAGIAMGLTTAVSSLAIRPLYLDGQMHRIALDSLLAMLSGLSAGILAQGFLPALEKVFKVTTAMTLKELNDASHPLLQRLAHEAPGTYQHSLRIADMAETAAESIGANGLLCRVGAMYHDIGKVNKPMYFIENQGGGPNRHNKLSPAMSLLIIVGHVKDGIELARDYALPQGVRHFIESHHGTTLVEYFYHAAKKQTEIEDKPSPSEFEFRYPGPKPQSKEAGIMLLCDSLEAAARTLPEPTPARIEQLVHSIANKRLMDGQFDECDLNLSELHRIEQAITKTLCAIYHTRIKYPGSQLSQQEANRPAIAQGAPSESPSQQQPPAVAG